MLTLLAFLAALALLIAVHEYGHYRMAVACGVRVLRYAIGFGPTLLRYQRHPQATEFVLGAIPLAIGGGVGAARAGVLAPATVNAVPAARLMSLRRVKSCCLIAAP